MSKTIVTAQHPGGPLKNGVDGCCTRWMDGFCSGRRAAEWLNSLGDDEAPYGSGGGVRINGHVVTNGEVRFNWLSGNQHVVSAQAELLRTRERIRRCREELKVNQRYLKELEKTNA
jgi:hypothetical protein